MFGLKSSQAVADHKAARRALADNAAREKAAGVTEETDTYLALNERVIETEKHVPWYRR